jgi:antitoxin HigA-1
MINFASVLFGTGLTPMRWKLLIIIKGKTLENTILEPIHPGEVLLEEYLTPLKISQNRLARDLGVPAQRINEIIKHKRSISIDTALRLSKYFKTTPQFWLNLQMHYDLELARDTHLIERIDRDIRENEEIIKNMASGG